MYYIIAVLIGIIVGFISPQFFPKKQSKTSEEATKGLIGTKSPDTLNFKQDWYNYENSYENEIEELIASVRKFNILRVYDESGIRSNVKVTIQNEKVMAKD
ncbi:hypothetical protein CN507_30615 [Bacillus cereus]|nr:hypothetical protein CN507_30615 [Bacillus cereus]